MALAGIMTETLYIDNDEALAGFFDRAGVAEFAAVDTEFMREKTYYPKLCLIQIAINDVIACIDPFAIKNFQPMLDLFADRDVVKVLHSVSQDMEVFLHTFDCLPVPVYDTQIAASLTGMGDQVSYAKLVNEMLGVSLDKSHTRTDWSRRPLDEAQLIYAADDVRYLAEIYPIQRVRLVEQGRLAWLQDDFDAVADPARYRPDPDSAWRRVKGYARLHGVDLAILSKLARYREQLAMTKDRPRRYILSDDQLLDLVKSKPRSKNDLQRRRGFNDDLISRHGDQLLAAVQAGLDMPREQWPESGKGKPLTANQEVLADILMGLLKYQAKKNEVSVTSMASRKDVEKLVRGKRDMQLMSGWRYELGGRILSEFLQGKVSASVENQQLSLTGC
jgi:ribonuclease D